MIALQPVRRKIAAASARAVIEESAIGGPDARLVSREIVRPDAYHLPATAERINLLETRAIILRGYRRTRGGRNSVLPKGCVGGAYAAA